MKQFRCTVFWLIFFISGYVYAVDSTDYHVKQVSDGEKVACPSRDFEDFLKIFSESQEVQIMFTKYPLIKKYLDLNAEPEPKMVTQKLFRDQVFFPVIPNKVDRKKELLVLRINKEKPDYIRLTVVKDNADYQVDYFFSQSSCWYLERIEDWSL